eukprot:7252223-Prorocentrum_lima.AAC.1
MLSVVAGCGAGHLFAASVAVLGVLAMGSSFVHPNLSLVLVVLVVYLLVSCPLRACVVSGTAYSP